MEEFINAIGREIKARLARYEGEAVSYEYGVVQSNGDGVVRLSGMNNCRYGELIAFKNDVYGLALDLAIDDVGVVLLNGETELHVGAFARRTGRVIEVPVGNALLGRVVDPIGLPLDGAPLDIKTFRPIEAPAPAITERKNIDKALQTGLLAIDSIIPIGRGQRELIIGDRQTGKTTIAIDCILNQKGENVICVYVAIGQKASSIAQIKQTLVQAGAMPYCVIVAATAGDCAAMQYIAPYAGCAIAEQFMYAGKDVLIVYDDLSKHAVSYRAMSLLLRRPPGREAYPGDVFYLHSRLLERAAQLSDALGGGSMTALPIVETMNNDISAYIPTNVISITDGQVYLETELFHAGVRPAINVGLSVSRVGRAAQKQAMRSVSGKLRLTLAQYRELQVFAQFGSDVDATTKSLLDNGDRLTQTLKQKQNAPYSLAEQVILLLSVGHMQDVPLEAFERYQKGLLAYVCDHCKEEIAVLEREGVLHEATQASFHTHLAQYVAIHPPEVV